MLLAYVLLRAAEVGASGPENNAPMTAKGVFDEHAAAGKD
jgi:hypothetical protein